jgi:hypothetical protein
MPYTLYSTFGLRRYPEAMEHDATAQQEGTFDPAVGMVVTEAGKARARAQLREAHAEIDWEKRDQLRARLGLAPTSR